MNTIKIYLDTDGSVRDLQKDFDLYQYEYQNKLINIFVPTSILARFVDNDPNIGYSCQLKMSAVTSGGIPTLTANFYTRYVKNVVTNGIEYALFERLMPYAFTIYSGVGGNAPQLTISVVNIELDENDDPHVISIMSSQTCPLDVNASTQIQDEPSDPSDVETLFVLYNGLTATLSTKQDKVDPNINENGDNHSVVDNLNYLIGRDSDLAEVEEQVRQNTEDIEDLKIIETFGLDIVGTMVIKSESAEDDNKLPTDEELDTFIENITGESEVKKGQAVFVHWDNYAVADKTALCLWNGTQYSYLDMTLRKAGNSVLGEIEGTYEVGGLSVANNFMVDIVAGQIKNIYRVNADGQYIDLKTALDQVKGKLVDGTPVDRAIADKNGNDIYDTYQTKSDGASKIYVQQYASPRALLELNYPDYATGYFKKVEATDTSYNKATASSSTGYTQLASIIKSLEADILLGNQNGVKNRIWLSADVTENIKLSVSTSYLDEDNNEVYLSIQNTDWISLTSGNARLIEIESVFDGLTDPITLPSGTIIRQQITLYRESSASATFTLLSNTTYNAYMSLNKIGYVRYNISSVPQGIKMGNDTATLDGNNNLVVSGNGEMEFEGGNSEPIATQYKLPMATQVQNGNNLPISSSKVYAELIKRFQIYELDGALIGTTISNALKTLLTTNPRPIIYFNHQYYLPTTSASTIWYWDLVNPDVTTGVLKTIYINGDTLDVTSANYPTTTQLNAKLDKSTADTYYASIDVVGGEYDPTRTYNQYDTCRHEGKAYYCYPASTATGAWDSTKWTIFDMGLLFHVTKDLSDKKLDKDTTTSTYDMAYVKKADGSNVERTTTSALVASSIVMRDGNNQVKVATTPTDNNHATSKKYVDDLILKIFPVGAVYSSSNNTNPENYLGGHWTALNGGNPVYIPKGDVPVITKSTEHDLSSANLKVKCAESNYANRMIAIDSSRQIGVDQNTTASVYTNSQIHPTNLYTKADTTYSVGVYMWERTS